MKEISVPVVLTFSGHDPTGGAGIQADIEALISQGCHCAPIVTANTIQDTSNAMGVYPLTPEQVVGQARAVLEDMKIKAIKIGLVPNREIAEAIHSILYDYAHIPVVLDPVIHAGGGMRLTSDDINMAIRSLLIPQTTVLTPNTPEARILAGESADSIQAAASELCDLGAEYVLVTGTHEETEQVENTLYCNHRLFESFKWDRLNHEYHGSGCTLAACIAGLLAHGADPLSAIHQAQEYTWRSLKAAYRVGMGQLIPNRLFWTPA